MTTTPNTLSLPFEMRSSLNCLLAYLFPKEKAHPRHSQVDDKTNVSSTFRLIEHAGPDRVQAEQFISQRFAESFGSRVQSFMPRLFSLRDEHGNICGAFGLRSASRKLFLERYLEQPIEKAIACRLGCAVERQCIVEVGHFSGTFPGAGVSGILCKRGLN